MLSFTNITLYYVLIKGYVNAQSLGCGALEEGIATSLFLLFLHSGHVMPMYRGVFLIVQLFKALGGM